MHPGTPENPTKVGGIFMLIFAGLILLGTVTRSWIAFGSGDSGAHAGLVGFETCYDGECHGKMFEPHFGANLFAFGGGIASVVLATIAGVLALGGNARKIPLLAVYIVLGSTLAAMLYYVGNTFSEMHGFAHLRPGYSFFVALMGMVGALIICAANLGPAARRQAGAVPMVPLLPMSYPCPRCSTQLHFVAQYQRWFCPRCQQYA